MTKVYALGKVTVAAAGTPVQLAAAFATATTISTSSVGRLFRMSVIVSYPTPSTRGTKKPMMPKPSAPIAGRFANLPEGGTIVVGNNTYVATYRGGDGNDLLLMVNQ